jgi:hypothetical protein
MSDSWTLVMASPSANTRFPQIDAPTISEQQTVGRERRRLYHGKDFDPHTLHQPDGFQNAVLRQTMYTRHQCRNTGPSWTSCSCRSCAGDTVVSAAEHRAPFSGFGSFHSSHSVELELVREI